MTAPWTLGPPLKRAPAPIPIVASGEAATRTVSLSATSRRLMFVEAQASGEREVGGGLYGRAASTWNRELTITAAHPPSTDTLRFRREFRFDVNALEADERAYARTGSPEIRCIGFWHSHPSGGVGLSRADLETFARMRAEWDAIRYMPQFVALIVTPDRQDGWAKPQLHGWRMWHENGSPWNERTKYEPVDFEVWGHEPDPPPQPTVEVLDDATRRRYLRAIGIDSATVTPERAGHVSARRPRRPETSYAAEAWMVATRTFTTTYMGKPLRIVAGADYARAGHELIQRHPDAWMYDRKRTERESRAADSTVVRTGGTVGLQVSGGREAVSAQS